MEYIVTYDVNIMHDAIKNACVKSGFKDYMYIVGGQRQRLPNTVLIVDANDGHDAIYKFDQQVSAVVRTTLQVIIVRKIVAFPFTANLSVIRSDETF